jgi:hypothetical protein
MSRLRSPGVVYAAMAVLAVLQAMLTAPALTTIAEALPRSVRSGGLALIYALAISLFGGTTQFAIKALIEATGSSLAPAWYVTGALVVGAVAMLIVRETAPAKAAVQGQAETGRVGHAPAVSPPS